MTMTPSAAAAMRAVPVEKSGVGSAVLNSFRQVGGSIGIALMGAIVAHAVGAGRPGVEASSTGFESALLVAAVIAFVGAVVATVLVRHDEATHEAEAPPSRWRRDEPRRVTRLPAAERRQAILDTALRIFSARSYRGVTTAEIAREAGVSEPVLYRHFASKRDLYLACVEEAWRELRGACEATVADAGDRERGRRDGQASLRAKPQRVQLDEALDPGDHRGGRGRRDPRLPARPLARGARLRRRDDPPRQEAGGVPADRDADAEAWIFLAGGLLRRSPSGSAACSSRRHRSIAPRAAAG